MMRGVSIIGVGMTPFGKHPERSLSEIAWPAVKQALVDAGVERREIGAAWAGTGLGGPLVGQRVLGPLGMTGIPVTNVENACSSGSTALHAAVHAVASGAYDVAMALGAEKLSRFGGGTIPLEKDDWEVRNGMVMPALYAMRARRYMHEYGAEPRHFALVSVKSRRNGVHNADAQMRTEVTLEEVLHSRMIADPLTLLQCCPTGDGAAAVIVASTGVAARYSRKPVNVIASCLSSGVYTTGNRDMTTPTITVESAKRAYEEAGVGPEDIDVAEVHDAFSSAEIFYYEALGFCGKGEGVHLIESGATHIGGRIPVNPSGGLLSKGHPIGATGAAQVVEIVRQLRGDCGARQVGGARIGITHATGGGITGFDHGACSIHILAA